ncbi:tyrosine recombinase XerC [Bacteroidia bacterium]|nr:tyrosine recombinase XerC [Bacteroidia bacterium]
MILTDFKIYLQLERSFSANTVDAYLHDVEMFDYFINVIEQQKGNSIIRNIEQATLENIKSFLNYLTDLGLSANTQARILSGLKAYYKFLLLEKRIVESPLDLIDTPKIGRKLPDVLSVEEIEMIINAIDLSKDEGLRNRAMLETLYSCGLRISELTSLRISNLFFSEGIISVIGKGDKQRLVPIGKEAMKQIELYLATDRTKFSQVSVYLNNKATNAIKHTNVNTATLSKSKVKISSLGLYDNYVFLNRRGKPLTRQMVFIIIKNTVEKVGINKKVSPHSFRHAFATHLVEGGADLRAVQEMLGHESITTTEIYTHLNSRLLSKTLQQFHPRYNV